MNGKHLVLKSQSKITNDQQLMSRAQNLALDIKQKIISQLEEGDLYISQDRSNLDSLVNQIQQKQRAISVPHFNYNISQFNKQDQQKIKQLIKKQRQYQQKLQKNARQLQQKVRMEELSIKQKQQSQRKQFFQQKKFQVMQSLMQIRQRHEGRKKLKQQQNANINFINSQKKLYEKLMQKWKQQHEKQEQQKNKKIQRLKQQKKINFQQIKEHAIRHDQTMMKFRQSRLLQSRASQPDVKKFYQSIFTSRIVQQQQEKRQKLKEKKKQVKQLAQKRSQYAEIVRQNYKPKVKQESQSKVKQNLKISKSLSHLQTVHKGNDYMRQINSRLNLHKKSTLQQKLSQEKKSEYFKYRNYLTQMRVRKSETEKQLQMEQRLRKNTYETQVKKIMNEAGLSEHERFNKAKLITKKFETSYQKKNTFKLIDNINAKIQILRHVSG